MAHVVVMYVCNYVKLLFKRCCYCCCWHHYTEAETNQKLWTTYLYYTHARTHGRTQTRTHREREREREHVTAKTQDSWCSQSTILSQVITEISQQKNLSLSIIIILWIEFYTAGCVIYECTIINNKPVVIYHRPPIKQRRSPTTESPNESFWRELVFHSGEGMAVQPSHVHQSQIMNVLASEVGEVNDNTSRYCVHL